MYKTPNQLFKKYLSPDILLLIGNNVVQIHDLIYHRVTYEIEDSTERGYLYVSKCQSTSKFICLIFKKQQFLNVLIICRRDPNIKKEFKLHDNGIGILAKGPRVIASLDSRSRFMVVQQDINDVFQLDTLESCDSHFNLLELLDAYEDRLLLMVSAHGAVYLFMMKKNRRNCPKVVFEMAYREPSYNKLFKDYLVTMKMSDGVLEIRDTSVREGNLIFSYKNNNAVANTLHVKYDKICFWEQNQVNILFVASILEDYENSRMQENKENKLVQFNSLKDLRYFKESLQIAMLVINISPTL